jgi:hypothetical protein
METSAATPTRPPHQAATSPSPSPSSSLRLWRPAAQRNMRNQWSHLSAAKEQWLAAVADGRAHASALVNVHLSCRQASFLSAWGTSEFEIWDMVDIVVWGWLSGTCRRWIWGCSRICRGSAIRRTPSWRLER